MRRRWPLFTEWMDACVCLVNMSDVKVVKEVKKLALAYTYSAHTQKQTDVCVWPLNTHGVHV